jgi:hypothetical protein
MNEHQNHFSSMSHWSILFYKSSGSIDSRWQNIRIELMSLQLAWYDISYFCALNLHFTFQALVLSPISSLLRWVCYIVYMLNKCSLWCLYLWLLVCLFFLKQVCMPFLAVFVWASALESLFNELLALSKQRPGLQLAVPGHNTADLVLVQANYWQWIMCKYHLCKF